MIKRSAIYLRPSTKGGSHDLEFKECKIFAASRGYAITKIYEDSGVDPLSTRTGMANLIKDSKEDKFDVIIFHSLDRPFVSMRHLCNTFRYWQSLGKSFVSIMDGIDTTSSMQTKNLSHLLMVLANFEGRVFKDRTKAGNIGRKARGAIDLKRTINRKQVIKQFKAGMKQRHIAKIHNCAASAICKIVREYRELELKKKGMVLQ